MKLLVRDDVCESQIYRDDAFIVVGKVVGHRGWYVMLNLSFIQTNVDNFFDYSTWEKRQARCYYRVRFKLFRAETGSWSFKKDSIWDEVNK